MRPYVTIKNLSALCKAVGLPESHVQKVSIRRDLVLAIRRRIAKDKLTQADAAKISGVGRTVVTAVSNGNIAKISTDRLIDIATNLGIKLRLKVEQ